MNTKQPLVSIVCLTYNAEKYVAECLDSMLMQQTTFSYEILVYDDASKDATPAIIQSYADRYPDIFRITLYKENNFQKGLGFYGLRVSFNEARGKYIAYLEGDDYWTDPLKLQHQVDFLESHPEYGCCCTRYRYYFENRDEFSETDHFEKAICSNQEGIEINHNNYFTVGLLPQILTAVYRKDIFPQDAYYFKLAPKNQQDDALFYCMTLYSKIWVMNEVMGIYRRHDYSVTWTVGKGGSIEQAKMLHDIWWDCWQYDKSEVMRGTMEWAIIALCKSTIKYSNPIDKLTIKQCIVEFKRVASIRQVFSLYWIILRVYAVRILKRTYKK